MTVYLFGECIEYKSGRISRGGYCQVGMGNRKTRMAHIIAWELFRGPVPEGLQLDHLCRNPACMNPNHLEPVTPRENVLRSTAPPAQNARKTHCMRGHPLHGDNLRVSRGGSRHCKACHYIRSSKYHLKNRLELNRIRREKYRAWKARRDGVQS